MPSKTYLNTIILAAGKGTRMKSPEIPKVLHKVNGESMIRRVVRNACKIGSKNIIIVIGYKGDMVRKDVSDMIAEYERVNNSDNTGYNTEYNTEYKRKFPAFITYVEQKEQLGTGHAVQQCIGKLKFISNMLKYNVDKYKRPVIKRTGVLVLCGDVPCLKVPTLDKLVKRFNKKIDIWNVEDGSIKKVLPDVAILSAFVNNPHGYGRICRTSPTTLSIVEEKDATVKQKRINEINAGIYIFRIGELIEKLPQLTNNNAQNEYYLTDLVGMMCPAVVSTVDDVNEIVGINTIEQLKEVNKRLKSYVQKGLELISNGLETVIDELYYIQ